MNFVAGNSKQLQKLGFEQKNWLSSHCVYIVKLKSFPILKMLKNKECVRTWANSTGYTSRNLLNELYYVCFFNVKIHKSLSASHKGVLKLSQLSDMVSQTLSHALLVASICELSSGTQQQSDECSQFK